MCGVHQIIPRKECNGCEHIGLYTNTKHGWHCYHPKRTNTAQLKLIRSEKDIILARSQNVKMADTSNFKPCPLLKRRNNKCVD